MAEPIHDKIKRSLQAAEGLYHRLVLLVGKTGSGKSGILRDIAEEFGSSVVNVNLALSGELLELTAKQRSLRLPGILDQIADQAQPPVGLGCRRCDNSDSPVAMRTNPSGGMNCNRHGRSCRKYGRC